MAITGNDEKSKSIIVALQSGVKVKEIPIQFGVSLDQAKRLSRYHNILEATKKHLSLTALEKVNGLGLKCLVLSPFYKQKDWEGLTEILSVVEGNVTREELLLEIKLLEEKRERIKKFQVEVDDKLASLQTQENKLIQLEEETNQVIKQIEEKTKFLKKYPKNARTFLQKHLGIYNNKLVLARRLYYRWQKDLKKKEILEYSSIDYIWYVKDLDALVEAYIKRIERKKPYPTEWDSDEWGNGPNYKLPNGLADNLTSYLDTVSEKKTEIEVKRQEIQKEIKQLKNTSTKSFIEAVEASNKLSKHDLKRHGELQDKALKWLYNQSYVVASEVTLPNGRRADVIGYDEQGRIVIIEVKVSLSDFRRDTKWESYLTYCDDFYFLLSDDIYVSIIENKEYGLLREQSNKISIVRPDKFKHKPIKEKDELLFSINRVLSRKFIYS